MVLFNLLEKGLLLTRKLLNQGFLEVKLLKSSFGKFYARHNYLVNRYGISVSQMTTDVPFVVITTRSFPRLWPIAGFVTSVTRRMPHMQQELLILPEYPSSPPVFSGVRVLYFSASVLLIIICPFDLFLLAIILSVLFWLPLWYLQTFLSIFIPTVYGFWAPMLQNGLLWTCFLQIF